MLNLISTVLGNSAYGRTLVNRESHTNMSFYDGDEFTVSAIINNGNFRSLDEIGNDLVEVDTSKSRIYLDVPIQIGFFVLEYGKLKLLSFYYDFLLKYLPLNSFCLIEEDTDSLYLALCEKTFYLTISRDKRDSLREEHDRWLAVDYCSDHKNLFFNTVFKGDEWQPSECCKRAAKFDSRTIGKFHVEWIGEGVIALCSKCYYCIGQHRKLSTKGISKTHNTLTELDFMDTLLNQTISQCTNKGFRARRDQMLTYTQYKKGLNYMYAKRIVCEDHITTLPTNV